MPGHLPPGPYGAGTDRGTFGGAYGLLVAIVVVSSAITATVALPTDPSVADRPQSTVDTLDAGIGHAVGAANAALDPEPIDEPIALNRRPAEVPTSTSLLPASALAAVPSTVRDPLRADLASFVAGLQTHQDRTGTVSRITPAVGGIVRGAVITLHGGRHTVEETIQEPYTVERQVVDRYEPVVDHYDRRWARTRPGAGWRRVGPSGGRVTWTSDHPGTGWAPTGQNRDRVVDVETTEAATAPGEGWTQAALVRVDRLRTGTAERHLWTSSPAGDSVYSTLLGYTHAGVVDTTRQRTGIQRAYRWSADRGARDRHLQLAGYRYAGIGRTKQVRTGLETQWRWADRPAPGGAWSPITRAKLFRGYRTHIGTSKPAGTGWQRAGVHHVETRRSVHFETRTVWGWHQVTETIPHIHYRTKKTWIPGRTETVRKKTWVPGHYKVVKKRKWVGWKRVTKKKWIPGRVKVKRIRKKVTRRKQVCNWKWSWRRGFHRVCKTKKVVTTKTVKKRVRTPGRWKRVRVTKWVGYRTVKKKRWVRGHWDVKTVKKRIPGRWERTKIRTGMHDHDITKTVWGPHQKRVKVRSEKRIKHYRWRKPVFDWKVKFGRPRYETSYQHRYERPIVETRYHHRYTKPLFEDRPIYRWERPVTETERQYERLTRWRRPVYRDDAVYRTEVETHYRPRTVTHDVDAAPLTYRNRSDWTLARNVTATREAVMTIERSLLEATRDQPTQLRASGRDGTAWTLSVWREAETIVVRTTADRTERISALRIRIDFDHGTINGRSTGIGLASGVTGPYTLAVRNGRAARGTLRLTIAGEPAIEGDAGNLAADEAPVTVRDGIVYSASFDVTVRTDRTTYTDRLTVEPVATEAET